MGHCCGTLLCNSLPAPQILRVLKLYYKVASSQLPAPQILRVLQLYYKVASSQLPAPQIAPRTRVVLPSHQFSSSSSPDTPRTKVVLQSRQCSPAFRALDARDLRRGLRGHRTNRTLACISRTRRARSPQRVARAWDKSHSRLHFAHSTRAISAEGCASSLQNERFVRDFLKNSHVKVCKTSVSYETSSKSQAETPVKAHTSRSPAKQFRDSSPSKQHPLTRQSQSDSDIHLYHNSQPHDSLRLPQIFVASTRLTRTKYCACHEMSPPSHLAASRFPAPATTIALPPFKTRTKSCACHEK